MGQVSAPPAGAHTSEVSFCFSLLLRRKEPLASGSHTSLPFLASWAQTPLSAPHPDFSPLSFSVAGMMPKDSFPSPLPAPSSQGSPQLERQIGVGL